MQPHERLDVWAKAHEFYLAVHKTTKTWPRDERFELTSQVRRAAFSTPANIAEGASRLGPRQFRHFLDIARGSLAETSYGLIAARDLGYITKEQWSTLDQLRDKVGRMLWGLLSSISDAADGS